MWFSRVLVATAVLLTGCQAADSPPPEAGNTPKFDAPPQVAEGSGDAPASEDLRATLALTDLTWKWNEEVAPIVRTYLDPEVSGETWVTATTGRLDGLRGIHTRMTAASMTVANAGLRDQLLAIVRNYGQKLDALTLLHHAVAEGDQTQEAAARQEISRTTAEGTELALRFLDSIRPFLDPDDLARELERRGQQASDLLAK